MPMRETALGLHISDTGVYSDVWLGSNVDYRIAGSQIGLTSTSVTGTFLSKTDSGRRDCVWQHSDVYLPANIDGATGTVKVSFLYSNTTYDIQDASQRGTVLGLLSDPKTQAELRTEDDGVGRYRYWYFTLISANGGQDAYVQEWGATQLVRQPVEVGALVVLATESDELSPQSAIRFARKTTPTLSFIYAKALDLEDRFDISGASITLRIAQSVRTALAGTFLLDSTPLTIDDGQNGEASVQLSVTDTTISEGIYVAELTYVNGGTTLRHVLPVEVGRSFV